MIGVGNDDQSLGKDRNMFQDARSRGLSREGSIEPAICDLGHEVIVSARRQFQSDFRITAMKIRQDAR